jgi:hypothetical protein
VPPGDEDEKSASLTSNKIIERRIRVGDGEEKRRALFI